MALGITRHLPWYSKIAAKVLLSRLPVGYHFFQKLSLFRHGFMDNPEYALRVFREHLQRVKLPLQLEKPFVVLELGPGDSLVTALVANAHGATRCYLVDAGPFAVDDIESYRRVATWMERQGLRTVDLRFATTIRCMLDACNATYETNGLDSLRRIPSASLDLVFSQAVLEHIRRHEFGDLLREFRRILKPDGLCSHQVDLRDHLGDALNNLRFSERIWEAEWMVRSGFYTNRIRYREMLGHFEQAGFEAEVTATTRWDTVPTPRPRLAPEFAALTDDDLCLRTFDVVLHPR